MSITLKQIKDKSPCQSGWETLLKSFNKTKADDTIVSIAHLLESNSIADTLWVINCCIPDELEKKHNMCADFAESAIEHAERVLPIFEKERTEDNRPRNAIEESKKCVNLLRSAGAAGAAGDAARAARDAARDAARAAAWAAEAAARATGPAARATWAAGAAGDAARAAGDAARATGPAARATWAAGAAGAAARAAGAAAGAAGDARAAWAAAWAASDAAWAAWAARAAWAAGDAGATWAAAENQEKEKQKQIILKYFG